MKKIPKAVQVALVRAARSGAQAAILVLGTGAVSWFDADWKSAVGAAGGMAIMSLLTSIAFPPPEGK
mgnify:FL=1